MKYHIAVSGLGVAGGTVALLLARQGHTVTVFEKAVQLGPVGGAVLLQPSGQLALKRIGLYEAAVQKAEPVYKLEAYIHTGKLLTEFRYEDAGTGIHAYGLHRADLFDLLHQNVLNAGVTIHTNTPVTGYTIQDNQIIPTSDSRPLGGFDFLIAADGLHSKLRRQLGLSWIDYEYPHGALWFNDRSTAVRNKLWQITEGTKVLCGLLPSGEGRCTFFWSLRKSEYTDLQKMSFETWKERVIRLAPQTADILSKASSFNDFRFTVYRHLLMKKWYGSHVLFMGDAAHAMSPHTGQGVNLALLDALSFSESISVQPDFQSACRVHVQNRRWHVAYYSALTAGLSPFFQSRGFVKGYLRDLGLPWMQKIPFLRRWMVRSMAGLMALRR